ncbi:MAG: alpha-amylase family glycosyl hydrolase [Eubacteriales bacterium]|nr:alpha-amylase family glycosyl hydrolase [Eubacteriales bacterium]
MWFDNAVIYQIYPLGLCGALRTNKEGHGIVKLSDWVSHIKKLGATCVLLNPVMESDYHGYDTCDFNLPDHRLGTKEELQMVCKTIHDAGLKLMFDGVFHHVGRGFWAFQDVKEKKWDSPYCHWFHINFDGNSAYDDGFWYEGWEGHYELVKLNLDHPEVRQHQFDAIKNWISLYDIDGLRLDVAYCLSDSYLRELRRFANEVKEDFVLLGETLHGDYNMWMNEEKCHSVTNYECYKGLYSSFNCDNMHEISFSLNRQFGYENWCIYRGKHLLSFVDNHDVERIASILEKKERLPVLYGLLFGMPGVPSIYYGSEWGIEGKKKEGDEALRPALDAPEWNELTDVISTLASLHHSHPALYQGGYRNLHVWSKQLVFERACSKERIIVALNMDTEPYFAPFDAQAASGTDLITGESATFENGYTLPPLSVAYWLIP